MRASRLLLAASLAMTLVSCDRGGGDDELPAPGNLRVSSMAPTAISLTWDDTSGGGLGHRIYRDDPGGAAEFRLIDDHFPALTIHTDGTVSPDDTYRYYVVFYDDTGESRPSNHVECAAADPRVAVLAPTWSDMWILGESYEILWDTNIPGFDARISVCVPSLGSLYHPILATSPTEPDRWIWKAGYDASGQQMPLTTLYVNCTIRVEHSSQASWFGESQTFALAPP